MIQVQVQIPNYYSCLNIDLKWPFGLCSLLGCSSFRPQGPEVSGLFAGKTQSRFSASSEYESFFTPLFFSTRIIHVILAF